MTIIQSPVTDPDTVIILLMTIIKMAAIALLLYVSIAHQKETVDP